jgi:hypothetical protein
VTACSCSSRAEWVVLQRNCNHSLFNGGRKTWSRYSGVYCAGCGACWRTKAKYVESLPDSGWEEAHARTVELHPEQYK